MEETKERVIFHSDLNCFYASVEMLLHPEFSNTALAVCGSQEDRHGIVLAKSEKAKRAGVKTGMAIWQAKSKCPDLIIAQPHFDQYLKFSRLVRQIYERYTDRIEPYGLDECWLDMTGSCLLYGSDPMYTANEIRKTIKRELGLTVSIGVSFNKVFAKLGSDLKKPDAVTEISRENFKQKIWNLPLGSLLYAGPSTVKKMEMSGILTIGDMARIPDSVAKSKLGKNGIMLKRFANGLDDAQVAHKDFVSPVKSVGHGITTKFDLTTSDQIWQVILDLCQDIGHRLKKNSLVCRGVSLTLRRGDLISNSKQGRLPPGVDFTQSALIIARAAFELYRSWDHDLQGVRSVSIAAIDLCSEDTVAQIDIFTSGEASQRSCILDNTVEDIRCKYGEHSIRPAVLLSCDKLFAKEQKADTLPGRMFNS